MFCRKCGKEISTDVAFCRFCGTNNPYYIADQAENQRARYCRKCGKQIESDSEFCCYCGTKVVIQSVTESTAPKVDQELKKTGNAPRKKTWVWSLFATVALLIIGFAISGFSIFNGYTIGSFLRTNFVFENFQTEPDYLLNVFHYTLLASAVLFPVAFIVGNIKTSRGPIKDRLNLRITPIYIIGFIFSLIGVLGGWEIGVITRVCAIISLICLLYYCASCKYFVVPCITALFILVLIFNTYKLNIATDFDFQLPMYEWSPDPSNYSYDFLFFVARAEISQFVCINMLVCSILFLIQSIIEKIKANI